MQVTGTRTSSEEFPELFRVACRAAYPDPRRRSRVRGRCSRSAHDGIATVARRFRPRWPVGRPGCVEPVLSADGKTLTVTAGRALHDQRGCQLEVIHDVVVTEDAVTLGLKDATAPEEATPMVCTAMYIPTVVEVTLDEPLGDRADFDGLRSKARTIDWLSGLVRVLYIPDGFETDPDVLFGNHVQQNYQPRDADWYFAVNQTKGFPAAAVGEATPIKINGIEGERITGQMNNTMESIRFEFGDIFVTVWGEVQGPPSFTHSDELLKIAEGIAPPDSPFTFVHPAAPDDTCLTGFGPAADEVEKLFVGLTLEAAEALAATLGIPFRLVRPVPMEANADCFPLRTDIQPTRVNAVSKDGKVTDIAMG